MGRGNENRGATGKSESHRVQRVEREVRDVVGVMLLGGIQLEHPHMVSVSRVSMTSDLRIARVYVTAMSSHEPPKATLDEAKNIEEDAAYRKKLALERKGLVRELNDHAYEVQNAIAKKLQMRFTPKVTFFYDEGFESAMKVENILRKLGEKKAPAASDDQDDE